MWLLLESSEPSLAPENRVSPERGVSFAGRFQPRFNGYRENFLGHVKTLEDANGFTRAGNAVV